MWLAARAAVLAPLGLLLWLAGPWLARLPETARFIALPLLFAAFPAYWAAAYGRIDQIFQRRRHDLQKALAKYMSDVDALTNLRQRRSQLGALLRACLYVDSFTLFVAKEEAGHYRDIAAEETGVIRTIVFTRNDSFVHWLMERNEIVTAEALPLLLQGVSPEMDEASAKFLASNDYPQLIVPLSTRTEFIGWIALGRRANGKPYGDAELEFLDQMRKSAAIALSNSLLFSQVQQSNASLEITVQQRTQELKQAKGRLQQMDLYTDTLELTRHKSQQTTERLKALDVAKTEFLAMANHELRHPLNAIRGFSEMLMELWDQTREEKKKEMLSVIYGCTTSMLALINDFLDISKIELGRFELKRAPTSLWSLAGKVIEHLRVQHAYLKFTVDFDDPSVTLSVDATKLEQVLTNLANNAAKYSPDQGTVTISGTKGDRQFLMAVIDEGPGIPPEQMNKVFHKFYRVETDDPHARKGPQVKGTGLGLAIAKNIVEMHGGKIWVENRTDKSGARFCISLPMA